MKQLINFNDRNRKNRLYLHIGTHKTGTTAIQNILIKNGEHLKKENIFFLGRFKKLIVELSEKENYSHQLITTIHDKIEAKIQELNANPDATFVISNEKLSGNKRIGYKNTDAVANHFKKVLDNFNFEVKIIVYLRRQDDFLESLYAQRIYNGKTYTFSEFLDGMDKDSFSWEKLLESYADLFGKDNIIVRIYHNDFLPQMYSIVNDFGKIIGSNFLLNYKENETVNMGYSRPALEIVRMITPILEKEELKSIKKLLRKTNQKKTFENYTLLKKKERESILERYSDSNSVVAKEYLGLQSAQLFPPIENDLIREQPDEISQKDIILIFSRALHQISERMNRIESRIRELKKKKTIPERIIIKIRRAIQKKN